MKLTVLVTSTLLALCCAAVAQVSGAQGAIASPRQNLATQQVSFPMQGGPQGLDPNLAFVSLDAELVSGTPHLLLKIPTGPFSFSTVTDLSALAGGGVNGSGTTNTIPLWTSSSTIGNSFLAQTGSGTSATLNVSSGTINVPTNDGNGNVSLNCTACGQLALSAPTAGGHLGAFMRITAGGSTSSVQLAAGDDFAQVFQVLSNNTTTVIASPQSLFANLPTPSGGQAVYCTNCAEGTNPCSTSGGTGAGTWAFAIGVPAGSPKWKCL